MSTKEVKRVLILQDVKLGTINLKKASNLLELSYPQTKRIWKKFKKNGPKGLISKKRGKKSNRKVPDDRRKEIAKIINERYYDCKPQFVSEKLKEKHNINYCSEFIRQLMIEYNLWVPKKSKIKIHQRRERREREGELVQMDASDHKWFENRGPRCHLHILVDDATSKVYSGYFTSEETTEGYFRACLPYFKNKGLPISFYNDKRGTFIVNQGKERGETQFGRAMKELAVGMIFAHSPQAKGRVERVFGTLQERLVWEMRIENISNIEEANRFLPEFFNKYNKQFAVDPANSSNAHRPLNQNNDLKYILCKKEIRTISKNLEVQYNNTIFQLKAPTDLEKKLQRAKIEVITTLEGEIIFQFQGKLIEYRKFSDQPYMEQKPSIDTLVKSWKSRRGKVPAKNHPWRKQRVA